ncbi:MAG: hypothetical protein J6Y36_04835 [Treponema sp.]|uniref:CdaR family protein n=1 Tax=Treponema sp. TaxID=166 RepID=UPI001B4A40FE|nr:CdaR family protein [Treponema sp.]MBP5402467.1 hypothetical protein [Treponema sp.]MBR5933266.1 hypothetical protein [Treponema sp.]
MKPESTLSKITKDWFAKCICIGAAILLYLFGQNARLEKRTLSVPLTTVEDGQLTSVTSLPSYVNVTLRSKSQNVANINSDAIEAVLDLSYYVEEGVYKVPVNLSLSSEIILSDPVELIVSPEQYTVKLEKKTRKSIPIEAPFAGDPLHGYEVTGVRINPPYAIINGPSSMVESIEKISTEEVALTERKDNFTQAVPLRRLSKFIEIISPYQASVEVSLEASLVTKSFSNCRVFLGNLNDRFEVENVPEISFTVSGAQLVLEKFYPSEYTVQCDCGSISIPGEYELPVVINIQDAFKIESQSAEKVKIVVKEKPAPVTDSAAENSGE